VRALLAAVVLAGLAVPATAGAAYTGTVDAGAETATLNGSGSLSVSTGGGLLHHSSAGFASDADFDSAAAGDQTVPSAAGWSVNVTGSGEDMLDIRENETTNPVAFASGHTSFPGGTPCIVRDPADRGGAIRFSAHPDVETRFCYPGGINHVAVHAGVSEASFTVIDTHEGVPLYLEGGEGQDELAVAANVPSGVGVFHNPLSEVHFIGGEGGDRVSFVDGSVMEQATYTIGNGAIRKSGLPPIVLDDEPEGVELYPHPGPARIDIERTGAQYVQIFGGFFGQEGPFRIDARGSDAAVIASGSEGADTMLGSAVNDYLGGGGGDDTIVSRDANFDTVECEDGEGTVRADTVDQPEGCADVRRSKPLIGFLRAPRFESKSVTFGLRAPLEVVSTVDGRLTLQFRRTGRKGRRRATRTSAVVVGPNDISVRTAGITPGRYKVKARIRDADGKRGPAETLKLRVRRR
jgi:hypothetical protein